MYNNCFSSSLWHIPTTVKVISCIIVIIMNEVFIYVV